ncbi:LRR receptor-like serine/threonine-protein kinase GSO1 [Senna tora]|uniref:LRR receptor-like serine/threonine-protein kinase GSO1 n=1 Tax=Senna tora TaxID=362788 RepID=A0A835CEF8_9FABA|nr:LRR receptor-like serine/threonine-protein kinase GSO1 [Senna tora]
MKMGWVGLVVLISAIAVMRKSMGWLEDEKRALVEIKHSLLLSWDVSDPNSDKLEHLDLSSNNLVGPLPIVQGRKSNSTFSMLEILDLSWNSNMNESIIKPLSTFASLKNLNLARCNINGAFPIQASVLDKDTFGCLLLDQENDPEPMLSTYPIFDRLVS